MEQVVTTLKKIRWILLTIILFAAARSLTFSKKVLIIINYVASFKNAVVLYYDDVERAKVIKFINKVKREVKTLMEINEAYQIFMLVKKTGKIKGDIAEVGVYKGGSAKIICEAKGKKSLHLFDTFSGLPKLSKKDDPKYFQKGEFISEVEEVKEYLSDYSNVHFYKGLFPSTADPVRDKKFSFVNLDVDIYESTLNCLKFFYPRMNRGAAIISHDYINAVGVKRAFEEFFKNKPEPIIELSGSQCLVVKT